MALDVHHIDAEVYGRIVDSGALEDQHVELIDGIIVDRSPQGELHALLIRRLIRYLGPAGGFSLSVQAPLPVAGDSLPEPDLALVEEPDDVNAHPSRAHLVVEVAVSSQRLDRGRKAELYGGADVPTYWLVDVPNRAVEVRTDPAASGYKALRTFDRGETVPSPLDGLEPLALDELFSGLD